ncbi:MAG TPA: permease [Geobacteraceae bacterium]|nr:permease [Geobacteraceae bacterium]
MATTSTASETSATGTCQVHGTHERKANYALLSMIVISLSLIAWHVWIFGPSIHGGEEVKATGPFPLLLGAEMWDLLTDKHGILAELWDVFPYFIAGVLLAGYIRTYKIAVKLQATLRRYGVMSVFIASFIGIITPLCACGTLTTAISLLFAGIPLAPVMSLLVTSPLMSPSTYLLTLNDLGPEWTVVRTLAALLMGIFAGLVTHFLKKYGFETKKVFIDGAIVRGDFHDEDYPDERLRCGCRQKFGNRVALKTSNMFLIFLAKSAEMLWTVGKYIIVGVVIGAVVERYMPGDWIYRFFGRKDPLNIVWVTFGSVPMFLHQISASSIIYHIKSSLGGTLDSGAALAFMVGGPVTAVPTMVMFWTIFKRRVFVLYMVVCITGTLLVSYGLQVLFFVPGVDTGNALLKGVNALAGGKAAIIRKQGENVRVVLDPENKPLVATYNNILGSEGGVVFDAGMARFRSDLTGRLNNRKYVENIANWLEQSSNATVKGNILVYDLSTGEKRLLDKAPLSALGSADRKLVLANRSAVPVLSDTMLEKYSQVWLFFPPGVTLGDAEMKAVTAFNRTGGALLLVSGGESTDAKDLAGINRISSGFGVNFYGQAAQQDEIPVAVAAPLFYRASEMLGKLLKLTHKA